MSYTDLIRRTWEQNILFSVLVELTYTCNLNCYYCYNDRNLQGKPLTTQQYFRFFEDLRDMGVLHLTLSGGEPLMHPDFFALGAKARKLGFVIRIKSNGHALNEESIRKIRAEIDPFMIDISLHGASAAVHERQTRVVGSFALLLNNLDSLAHQKQRFRLNSVLTSWNEHEAEQMFALAHTYDMPLNMNMTISPCDNGTTNPLSIIPSDAAILKTIRLLDLQAEEMVRRKGSGQRGIIDCDAASENEKKQCGSASATLAVDPFGNVLPCVQWRESAGSLHEQSLKVIWESSELLQKVRAITQQGNVMIKQKWSQLNGAGYCPALANILTGDPLQEDSQTVRLMTTLNKSK